MSSNHANLTPWERARIAWMWFFLAPLIFFLGVADILTNGKTRNWPLGEPPRHDKHDNAD